MRMLLVLFTFLYMVPGEASQKHSLGLRMPLGWQHGARYHTKVAVVPAMPVRFSLADKWGYLPPVRDQGACGSCWAHASTEAVRLARFWRTGKDKDLSVQEILSCSHQGSCNGGWFAHEYEKVKGNSPETGFPYVARDAACKRGLKDDGKIASWAYLGGPQGGATTTEIKAAIFSGHAVAAVVAVDQAFEAYKGGIFTANYLGQPNHMITLVGWDDEAVDPGTGDRLGVWILRNQWAAKWGEKHAGGGGYMRIAYGTSAVGSIATDIHLP